MALSLDAIYAPFNAFFTTKFVASGAPVKFRFAGAPYPLSDSDFALPTDPATPLPALAQEVFSGVVDKLMRLDDDGKSVWQGASKISDFYEAPLLAGAVPFVPASIVDPGARQSATDTFNAAKTQALELEDTIRAASLAQPGTQFRPTFAQPVDWWDRTNDNVWTHQSFDVQGAVTNTLAPDLDTNLWKLRLTNVQIANVIQNLNKPDVTRWQGIRVRPNLLDRIQLAGTVDPVRPAGIPVTNFRLMGGAAAAPINRRLLGAQVEGATPPIIEPAGEPSTPIIPEHFFDVLDSFPVVDRMDVNSALIEAAPTEPVTTDNATISFSYCVVTINRAWFYDPFIENLFWQVIGYAKGTLSQNDGASLNVLPVGFVALKDLQIEAPWTTQDISNLEQSVQFGPFNFDSQVTNNIIGHSGIQIVGWMLRELPALPPN